MRAARAVPAADAALFSGHSTEEKYVLSHKYHTLITRLALVSLLVCPCWLLGFKSSAVNGCLTGRGGPVFSLPPSDTGTNLDGHRSSTITKPAATCTRARDRTKGEWYIVPDLSGVDISLPRR
jgi:hypothetical protein